MIRVLLLPNSGSVLLAFRLLVFFFWCAGFAQVEEVRCRAGAIGKEHVAEEERAERETHACRTEARVVPEHGPLTPFGGTDVECCQHGGAVTCSRTSRSYCAGFTEQSAPRQVQFPSRYLRPQQLDACQLSADTPFTLCWSGWFTHGRYFPTKPISETPNHVTT